MLLRMAAKLYTVKAVEDAKTDRHGEDARDKIAADLAAHYEKTWSVLLERREGGKWTVMRVIDVLHPDEVDGVDGLTTNAEAVAEDEKRRAREEAIAELTDAIVGEVESEAAVDGPTRVRATGRPERVGARALWVVPWISGGELLPSEQKLHAADANVAALTSTSLQLDRAHRSLDRMLSRMERMCDKAERYHDVTMDSSIKLIETLQKVEGPSIAAATIKLQQQTERAEHERSLQEDKQNHELLMSAITLIAKGLDADRRDKKEERERARGKVVDTTASETPPPPDEAKRPEVPRCDEARELLDIFDDLSPSEVESVRKALKPDEWSAVQAASDAATIEGFDIAFGKLDESVQQRGQADAAAVHAELVRVIGMSKCLRLMALWRSHEQRNP